MHAHASSSCWDDNWSGAALHEPRPQRSNEKKIIISISYIMVTFQFKTNYLFQKFIQFFLLHMASVFLNLDIFCIRLKKCNIVLSDCTSDFDILQNTVINHN